MPLDRFVPSWMRRFARDESGVMTVHNLFLTVTCCAVGAAGLDVTHFYAARTQLQVAADVGAHAALYTRYHGRNEAEAKAAAVQAASYGIESSAGPVVTPDEVVFGTWNDTTSSFTALPAGGTAMPTAVEVTTSRAGDNPVGSFLFRIIGVDHMDVRTSAVYRSDGDPCRSLQGLFAEGKVWVRSGNNVGPGACFHSNNVVETQNNNDFQYTPTDPLETACQSGTGHAIISMPDSSRLGNGNKNECIAEAKQNGTYDLAQFYSPLQGATTDTALLSQVEQVMVRFPTWSWDGIRRNYINPVPVIGNNAILTALPLMEGSVHYVNCNGSNLTLSGTWRRTVLLLNDCDVKAQGDLILSDTVLYNTNTDDKTAFNFGSGRNAAKLVIGDDTDCNGTGAAYLLTRGGFDSPAKLSLNNGTIIARGNVQFAAQFGGAGTPSKGMAIIAGGTIDGTSEGTFIPCPPPPPGTPPVLATFRMAR